jgi:hypothetical protein
VTEWRPPITTIIINHQPINAPTAGAQAFLIDYTQEGHNPPRGPSAGWWVLSTANEAGTNGLTCLTKHRGAQDNQFLVTHLMTDQRCLTYAIARRSALTAGPSSSSNHHHRLGHCISCGPMNHKIWPVEPNTWDFCSFCFECRHPKMYKNNCLQLIVAIRCRHRWFNM